MGKIRTAWVGIEGDKITTHSYSTYSWECLARMGKDKEKLQGSKTHRGSRLVSTQLLIQRFGLLVRFSLVQDLAPVLDLKPVPVGRGDNVFLQGRFPFLDCI